MQRSLVLETWNLGSARRSPQAVEAGLARLLNALATQTLPLAALRELVVTHDGFSPEACARLESAAGRPIAWCLVAESSGYYEHKNAGFDTTTAPIVAFTDGDCTPCPLWLERLTGPIVAGEARVVAGPTRYPRGRAAVAGTAIDFPLVRDRRVEGAVRNFFANNVAFAREVFAARRYSPVADMFKGPCQVLALRLRDEGIPIRLAPDATLEHAWPEGAREMLAMRLQRGADVRAFAPRLVSAYAPKLERTARRLGPIPGLALLGARAVRASAVLVRERPRAGELVAGVGVIAATAVVDAVGALGARSVRRRSAARA